MIKEWVTQVVEKKSRELKSVIELRKKFEGQTVLREAE